MPFSGDIVNLLSGENFLVSRTVRVFVFIDCLTALFLEPYISSYFLSDSPDDKTSSGISDSSSDSAICFGSTNDLFYELPFSLDASNYFFGEMFLDGLGFIAIRGVKLCPYFMIPKLALTLEI